MLRRFVDWLFCRKSDKAPGPKRVRGHWKFTNGASLVAAVGDQPLEAVSGNPVFFDSDGSASFPLPPLAPMDLAVAAAVLDQVGTQHQSMTPVSTGFSNEPPSCEGSYQVESCPSYDSGGGGYDSGSSGGGID